MPNKRVSKSEGSCGKLIENSWVTGGIVIFGVSFCIYSQIIQIHIIPSNDLKKHSYLLVFENQPKSHFLFHKNVSLRDFYIMTLVDITERRVRLGIDFLKKSLILGPIGN